MKPVARQDAASPDSVSAHRRRGAALLLVLALLALILVLVLVTLRSGGDHARNGQFMAVSLEADALTRLPVNMVLAQLKAGTVDLQPGTVWASQPGMIRTFRINPGAEKNNSKESAMHHRLYSAPLMSSPDFDAAAEAAALSGWEGHPSAFTDLNEPVPGHGSGSTELVYPIADPSLLGRAEGFSLRSAAPAASPRQPLPLPAAWIYVLRDGQLITPTGSDGKGAAFDETRATSKNPIIARVAFWTDDESSKLNLNTATEPAPWDMPAANTMTERRYAENPPTAAEAYRISTHPAFTGLSGVLRHFGEGQPGMIQWPPDSSGEEDSLGNPSAAFYQPLVPDGAILTPGRTIRSKKERLFSNPEEFYYDPQRQPNGLGGGFRMTREDLRRSRFLLTTDSASPELNPWGQPKIALWMMPRNPEERSAEDRRMNACSMLPGGGEFIFQRAANWSSPASPGSSQSMTADWEEVPRNRELYAWLQSMTDQPLPGWRGSFLEKYGVRSRDQILTSMLDMLRWSANPEPGLPPPAGASNPRGLARESAVPLTINNSDGSARSRGFGRFPTTREVAIVFAFTDVEREANGLPRDVNGDGICDRATKLRAFMVVDPFIAAAGPPAPAPAFSLRIRRLQHFTIGQGIGLLLPGGNARNRCTFSGPDFLNAADPADSAGFASQFLQADGQAKEIGNRDDPARGFAFISSSDVRLPEDAGQPGSSIRFSGGAIIVDFMEPGAPPVSPQPNDSIHSVEIEFPDRPIPLPSLAVADMAEGPLRLDKRFSPVATKDGPRLSIIRKGDIVRSMILNPQGPSGGDARMVAARREVLFANDEANRGLFAPHPDYDSLLVMQARNLKAGIPAGEMNHPPEPRPLLAGSGLPGDSESGPGRLPDGPFVNRSARQPLAAMIPQRLAAVQSTRSVIPFSPVNFGAIPSGVYGDARDPAPRPWQTLLFCPNPAGRTSPAGLPGSADHDHPGFASPPDHLWLEFFWNPVVEPRPLSAGLATAGKVNLNFQILPWIWLRRSTALHGALQGLRLTAIPSQSMSGENPSAKGNADGSPGSRQFRYAVDAGRTLSAFEQRFDAGGIFRYPSEICDMFLVPRRLSGGSYESPDNAPANPGNFAPEDLTAWWNGKAGDPGDAFEATGDNLRESPYAQLYSRVATQSNVFRVHYRVQVLKKVPGTPAATWREARDVIISERRGSCLIERRFAPSGAVPDPASLTNPPSLHTRQQLVVTAQERFTP